MYRFTMLSLQYYNNLVSGVDQMEVIKKLYFKDWIRIPVKFIFSCIVIKVGYDYYDYRVKYAMRGPNPRSLSFTEQCPVVPHLPEPYPHYKNYEQYLEIKAYNDVSNKTMKAWIEEIDKRFVYSDAPCRQNVNCIDRFFLRAKQHTSAEVSQFYFLSELAKKEGAVPTGVFQEIRKNRQDQVQVQQVLVPKL